MDIKPKCNSRRSKKKKIEEINITDTQFNSQLPVAQLHWIIADSKETITVEAVQEGIKIYENPIGILTNNPTFDKQMFTLSKYRNLSAKKQKKTHLQKE